MENLFLSGFKLCILIISFVMFCVQFRTAVIYLMDPPTVDSSSVKRIEEIDLPLITVCPTNQTNITVLTEWFGEPDRLLGGNCEENREVKDLMKIIFEEQLAVKTNETFEDWFAGLDYETGSKIYREYIHLVRCWDMPWLNLTYKDLLEVLYDKEAVTNILFNIVSEGDISVEHKIIFLPAYGFCKELTYFDPTHELYIQVRHLGKTRVFLTDRNSRSHSSLSYSTHRGSPINVENGKTTRFNVKIDVMSSCGLSGSADSKDYFSNCVDNEIQNEMGKTFGCVPPWMSANNHCNGSHFLNSFDIMEFNSDFARTALSLRNNRIEKSCERYCSLTESTVSFLKEEIEHRNKFMTQVSLVFDHKVKHLEIVYSYSWFNFIIDVGSSLGLWLGLSALSLADFAAYIYKIF